MYLYLVTNLVEQTLNFKQSLTVVLGLISVIRCLYDGVYLLYLSLNLLFVKQLKQIELMLEESRSNSLVIFGADQITRYPIEKMHYV